MSVSKPTTGAENWRESLTPERRNRVIRKMVSYMSNIWNITNVPDYGFQNYMAFIRKIENDMYVMATSVLDYYHLIALKIYKLRTHLQEQHQLLKQQKQGQRQQQQEQQQRQQQREQSQQREKVCGGKHQCTIPHGAKYYAYHVRYTFCEKCFNAIVGDSVTVRDDPLLPCRTIRKDQFVETHDAPSESFPQSGLLNVTMQNLREVLSQYDEYDPSEGGKIHLVQSKNCITATISPISLRGGIATNWADEVSSVLVIPPRKVKVELRIEDLEPEGNMKQETQPEQVVDVEEDEVMVIV